MLKTFKCGMRSGTAVIPASKSAAHRQLICAALSKKPCNIVCGGMSEDISATIRCLNALGARISVSGEQISVVPPVSITHERKHLRVGESGSTLRFLLPVVSAIGADAVFHMEGKLPSRPHGALTSELRRMGAGIVQDGELMSCSGQLKSGTPTIPGDIPSQFISGLLFALPLLEGDSTIHITGKTESLAYITMTEQAISAAGIRFEKTSDGYFIPGGQTYDAGNGSAVESDWSNAAFFLCMGAMSEKGITVKGPDSGSAQGDKAIIDILKAFGADVEVSGRTVNVKKSVLLPRTVDASGIPDLVPVISVLATAAVGDTEIINAGRLRFKESDRLKSTASLICSLGGSAEETEDGLIIHGTGSLAGGVVDAVNDHRIAMSAAVAASVCTGDVTVSGAECVAKSYPAFWTDAEALEVC
ncbi:MAG: 3-phosphoshikimate 1-carboxyvinyltransferase [Clostridia bacterium]|nr:3-phosphoshikimate 1-carboxyvinyltransferase [Clostridia bacterium]